MDIDLPTGYLEPIRRRSVRIEPVDAVGWWLRFEEHDMEHPRVDIGPVERVPLHHLRQFTPGPDHHPDLQPESIRYRLLDDAVYLRRGSPGR
jgi:hypothetical protein